MAAGEGNGAFASPLTVPLPSQPTTTTHQPTAFTIADGLGHTTIVKDGASKPSDTKKTSTRKPLKVKPIAYINAEGSTVVVTPEKSGGFFTTDYHDAPDSKPLTIVGEDGKRTTIKWDGAKTSKLRTPTPKVSPIPKGRACGQRRYRMS